MSFGMMVNFGTQAYVALVVVAAYAGLATGVLIEKFLSKQLEKRKNKEKEDVVTK